jgi:hypothetical protein
MQAVVSYLDPGTGSMLLQLIVGGAAAAAVTLKMTWRRITDFLHISKRDEPESEARPTR